MAATKEENDYVHQVISHLEKKYGNVDYCHRAHKDIRYIPQHIRAQARSDEDQQRCDDVIATHKHFAGDFFHDVENALIDVIQVAEKSCERKQYH